MNLEVQTYSKETIRARMLQNVTKLWGVKNVQYLDPFVKLLVDAISTEIFKTNNEIKEIDARIAEKIARILTPTLYTHPHPAHGIAICEPIEDREILPAHKEFVLKKPLGGHEKGEHDKQLDLSFTPIENVGLVKMQVLFMATRNTLFQFDQAFNKIPISRLSMPIDSYRTIHIGIHVDDYDAEFLPEKLVLYCPNETFEHIDFVYSLMPFVEISSEDGRPLRVKVGRTPIAEEVEVDRFAQIFDEQSVERQIEDEIGREYRERFIEISGFQIRNSDQLRNNLPSDIGIDEPLWEGFKNNKILWLKLKFPPQFTTEILEGFSFVLNAFPVYNRAWRKTEYRLDIVGHNIPLNTRSGEYFLYVQDVKDDTGRRYTEIPFSAQDSVERGLYTVRKSGMERFTKRNAIDSMEHVMELLRDEVASFSIINRDSARAVLEGMTGRLKSFRKKLDVADRNMEEDYNYVIIEPFMDSKRTYASYWITNCALANNLRPGIRLDAQDNTGSVLLITRTRGGAEAQKRGDMILAYRYALTTHDKIISVEDVKNYCRKELKHLLVDIVVKRGTMASLKPSEGFIRTLDVTVFVREYNFYGGSYWAALSVELQKGITSKAIDGMEYRVEILPEVQESSLNG